MPQVNEFSWLSSGFKLMLILSFMLYFTNMGLFPSLKSVSSRKEFYFFNFLV